MARILKPSIVLLLILAAIFVGCNKTAPASGVSSNTSASGSEGKAAASTNSSSATQPEGSSAEKPAQPASAADENPDPAKMIGRFKMTQVHKDGVVSMISERNVEISFSPDGSYSRTSKAKDKDKAVHDDHGQYRIENGNQLVLSIQVSKKTIHNPPIEKRHKIGLSKDGEELRMITEKGDVAVFRRVK